MTSTQLIIRSVNISKQKGTVKESVSHIDLDNEGVQGDAHAGPWHRQISLLGVESYERFSKISNMDLSFGAFAENISTEGIELKDCHPLDRFRSGDVELELTQVGKKCHGSGCAIFSEVGECVMPKEGIFCRVIKGGRLQEGDRLEYIPKVFSAKIITLSDRAFRGEYEDKSGPEISRMLQLFSDENSFPLSISTIILPDEATPLRDELRKAVRTSDFIITTGGTGIGKRDITPEIAREFIDKEVPGIMEMIRMKYGSEKPQALLSRGICGMAGNTFLFTLPGSVRGVREYMQEILPQLKHIAFMAGGLDLH